MESVLKEVDERIKIEHPEFVNEGIVDKWKLQSSRDKIPNLGLEYLFWNEFRAEYYWRALQELKSLLNRNQSYFSDNDLNIITETMIQQTMEGKKVASSVPLYSDVFLKIGAKESSVAGYVKDTHKERAVNFGFWNLLKANEYINWDQRGTYDNAKALQESAVQELDRLFKCDGFFDYFDFRNGAEKAKEIPFNLCFWNKLDTNKYMRWLLVQEEEIYKKFERKEKDRIFGTLAALLVYELFIQGDDEESNEMKKLASFFIRGNVIKTEPIQKVLGRIFELKLIYGFNGISYHFDVKLVHRLEKILETPKEHIDFAWKNSREIKLDKIDSSTSKYIPSEIKNGYVDKLMEEVKAMDRFDINLFSRWMSDSYVREIVPKFSRALIKNKTLGKYFSQKQRPSSKDLRYLKSIIGRGEFGSNYLGDKTRGYLFMDLLNRKKFRDANDIIIEYNVGRRFYGLHSTERQTREFIYAVAEYVSKHRKVKVDKEGLEKRICYPKYNKIPDFVEQNKALFEII